MLEGWEARWVTAYLLSTLCHFHFVFVLEEGQGTQHFAKGSGYDKFIGSWTNDKRHDEVTARILYIVTLSL